MSQPPDPDEMEEGLPRPSWRTRRRIVLATLLFCAGEVLYLTGWGRDTGLHETLANGVLILAGSVIGAYVFGAVWDDANVMTSLGGAGRRPRPYREPTRWEPPTDDKPPTPPEGYAQ